MHQKLRLRNFTAFVDSTFEWTRGINVLVGPNATGKTHVLKTLYSLQYAAHRESSLTEKLMGSFKPDALGRLAHRQRGVASAQMKAVWNGATLRASFSSKQREVESTGSWPDASIPVFIPVKDMLAHSKGFQSAYALRELDFDEIYNDILTLAFLPPLRGAPTGDRQRLLNLLGSQMNGRVFAKGERFYLRSSSGALEMPLVAEGLRKLALLYLLIQNGSLSDATVLFWDEPEANLNPSTLEHVVGILIALAKMGVQIFLATHSFIVLKELELQIGATDPLRIFGLEKEKSGGIRVQTVDRYADLSPNPIEDEFLRIYDLEVKRAIEGRS